jgi:hypothetical protein
MGTAFVHTVIDDYSRVAYAEIDDDETAATAIGVLRNAVAWVRRPPQGATRMAARVQPSPAPHRDRQPPAHHPLDQPGRAVHLDPHGA